MKGYILLSVGVFVALSLNAKDIAKSAHKVVKVKSEKIINPFGGKVPDFAANKRATEENKMVTEENKMVTEENKMVTEENKMVTEENKMVTDIIAGH